MNDIVELLINAPKGCTESKPKVARMRNLSEPQRFGCRMTTRIREIRKGKGLTLEALAKAVGTTAQTIQRLETNNMTVSIDWLTRIAAALGMSPAALLQDTPIGQVRLLGELDGAGVVAATAASQRQKLLSIHVPGSDPVAVKITERFGPHEAGTILVANPLATSRMADADGRDCLVQTDGGPLLFRRIVLANGGMTTFVPYQDRARNEHDLKVDWLATVSMAVRYLDID